MAERITRERVAHIARLARLDLDEREMDDLTRELGAIVAYVDVLAELDLADVEPLAQPFMDAMRLRPDEPAPTLANEDLLRNAPAAVEGQFRVPRIIAGGDE